MVFKNPTFNSLPAHRTILHLQCAPHTNVPNVKERKKRTWSLRQQLKGHGLVKTCRVTCNKSTCKESYSLKTDFINQKNFYRFSQNKRYNAIPHTPYSYWTGRGLSGEIVSRCKYFFIIFPHKCLHM